MNEGRAGELSTRLSRVRSRVAEAAQQHGLSHEPTLIVVTKNFPVQDAAILADLGVRDLGENRDQEASLKAAQIEDFRDAKPGRESEDSSVRWHFIGQLQSKKAKSVARYASTVHSVDRLSLVQALGSATSRAQDEGLREPSLGPLGVLVQVSLDPEAQSGRGGIQPQGLDEIAESILSQESLTLKGLMAVAPLGWEAERAFAPLRDLSERLCRIAPQAQWISAGMSQDFEAALASGATHLRIGSDVLGPRPPVR